VQFCPELRSLDISKIEFHKQYDELGPLRSLEKHDKMKEILFHKNNMEPEVIQLCIDLFPNLSSIDLWTTILDVNSAFTEKIKEKNLYERLNFSETNLSPTTLHSIIDTNDGKLTDLVVRRCALTDEAFMSLEKLTNLKTLDLWGVHQLTQTTFEKIPKLTALENLVLSECKISDKTLQDIGLSLPGLKKLVLRR